MNNDEISIYNMLQANPGMMRVTPNGRQLYVLIDGGMACLSGENLHLMNDDELKEFVKSSM